MFKTIKLFNQTKTKEHIFIEENDLALNNEKSTEKITEFFKNLFCEKSEEETENIKPCKMKTPFYAEEIRRAISK